MATHKVVTLEDVAREAGVSVSTASRTLNGRPGRVGVKAQDRVRAVALRLGYATNLAAQATAIGRSRSIGVVVGDIPDDYQNPVMTGVFRAASSRRMLVTTAVAAIDDIDGTRNAVRQLRGQRPSLLIVAATESRDSPGMEELITELQHVEDEGTRVVLIGLRNTPFDAVVVDDELAGHDMAVALAGNGYTDFAVIAGLGRGELSRDRALGFRRGLEESGIDLAADRIIWQNFTHDGGYRAVGEALSRRPVPRALFCVNDALAIGACVRLREHGFTIGSDIAVAGCDDIPALRDIDPPLTTMHLPWTEAAEHAFTLATHDRSDARTVVLQGYPVIRASTPDVR